MKICCISTKVAGDVDRMRTMHLSSYKYCLVVDENSKVSIIIATLSVLK